MSNHEEHCHCHNHSHNHGNQCHSHSEHNKHYHCHDELHHEPSHAQCHEHHHEHACGCGCSHEHHSATGSDLAAYIISLLLFAVSLISGGVTAPIASIAATLICGHRIFTHGIKSLIKLRFDENTLIVIAAVSSVILGEYHEAYLITLLFSIGEFLEGYAVGKSRGKIEGLIDITNDTAHNELGEKIDPKSLKTGDKFLVKPGDKVCVDAVIESGSSSFDTSNITGESVPRDLTPGDRVVSGYVNLSASVVCTAVSDYANSTAAKIKEYVENASSKKANTERFITKFASIYTPAIICIALVMGICFAVFGITDIAEAVKRSLTFMIASCPCALVISIPLSYYASIGAMSKYGLLVKGSGYINTMAKSDAIAFDKTGTLTKGVLKVQEVLPRDGITKSDALRLAKSVEIHSAHPVAEAICSSYDGEYPEASDVKEHFGKGMEAYSDGHRIIIGTYDFCIESGVSFDDSKSLVTEAQNGIILCIDGTPNAVIKISDEIKPDAPQMIENLKSIGMDSIYMLSGDSASAVSKVCSALGSVNGFGDLLPTQKAEKIKEIKSNSKAVIFVGDGVNDAPSLTEADFSVSVGSGSSLALETGDATLISDSLGAIPKSIKKAKHTMRVIYTNIALALAFKLIVLILAAAGIAPIWLAIFADVGILMITVLNSLTILK